MNRKETETKTSPAEKQGKPTKGTNMSNFIKAFSVEGNAKKFMNDLKTKYPERNYAITFGGYETYRRKSQNWVVVCKNPRNPPNKKL